MHEEADLLDSKGQVRGEVLEGTNEAPVLRGVGDWSALEGGQLVLSFHRSSYKVAFRHASTLEEINGVLSLRKEQSTVVPCHQDAEEVVEVAKVRHGELRGEAGDDVLEKSR